MRSGPVTARITKSATDTVDCEAWGGGATEFAESLPAQLGARRRPLAASVRSSRRSPRRTVAYRTCGSAAPTGCWKRSSRRCSNSGSTARTPAGRGAAGHQVRGACARARSGPHAGAAVRRGVAAHPVVGVSPRQRRPRPGPHDRGLRAAGRLTGTADPPDTGAGPHGTDVAAGGRRVDRRRDRTARVRRRRRVVGRRLPPGQDDRVEPARASDRRPRDGRAARAAAPAPSPRGAAAGGQRAGVQPAVRRRGRRFRICVRSRPRLPAGALGYTVRA